MVSRVLPQQSTAWGALNYRQIGLTVIAMLALGGISAAAVHRYVSSAAAPPPSVEATTPAITTVTALGRLEPQGEIIRLSAPSAAEGNRVVQLRVEKGDAVAKGDVIAVLDSRDRLQADLNEASQRVQVAQAELARIKAGAQTSAIAAQQAEIARLQAQRQGEIDAQIAAMGRLQAEYDNAQADFQRYQRLYAEGVISASERDSRQLTSRTTQRRLQEAQAVLTRLRTTRSPELLAAQANLERIAEVRPVDVSVAQAEVARAQAAVQQAQARLAQAYVRSPQAGVILDIMTRPGEAVSNEGIVEMGQTQQMYAIAEVYQSDIHKVKLGQPVTVVSQALPQPLQGTVAAVGTKVQRQSIINTDPSENIDGRVVEVQVRLDPEASEQAAQYSNLQVTVTIQARDQRQAKFIV